MNRTLAALCSGLALALFAAARSAPRAEDPSAKSSTVRFERAPWKTGDTIRSSVTVDSTLSVTMSIRGDIAQAFDQTSREVLRRKTVVLAAKDGQRSKVSVRYDEVVDTATGTGDDEADAKAPSPLIGKTFVLEQSSKGVTIADEDGTVAGEDVASLVREKELARDGSMERGFDRLALLVSETSRKLGEKLTVPEDVALELAGADSDLTDARMSLRFVEVREIDGASCGVFEAEIHLSGKAASGEYKTAVELGGEVAFRVEGARFASAELSGKVTIDGAVATEEKTVAIAGEGPLKIVETAVYGHEER
jgi:hypothetical protein